jgi:glyoxylase-like metal-dependent hydrolase (beta-lactamase superfamily II)/rhodanese-related sulfurtransferase
MYFKQFYLGCLAHASYLIGSEGEAVVVDPQRDVEQYIAEANTNDLRIKYVIETHLHADFVSGHQELAARTGAAIIFGQKANAAFVHLPAQDGDEFQVGAIKLRVWETPGHTPESISILVEEAGQITKVLTGDTLFIGDVGRPDLVGSKGFSAEQMASMLYDSLHGKLLTLEDSVEVWPAHGAGSLCGRNMSKETSSTIGQQRQFNYALKPMLKDEFVKMMTTDLPEVPAYFPKDVEINRTGAAELEALPRPAALAPNDVQQMTQQGVTILDVRSSSAFGNGHIPGALNIGLGGQFASWAGTLLKLGAPMTCIAQMPVDELQQQLAEHADLQIIDVRRPAELATGRVPGAINAQLAHLEKSLSQLDPARPTVVICAGGYRSTAATSVLARHGFTQLFNVVGGTSAWINAGYPVEGAEALVSCQC